MNAQYQCNNCGRGYVCPPRQRVGLFCSARCRRAYWMQRKASGRDSLWLMDDASAPTKWDGRSQYSTGVMVHTYRVYCVCCGSDAWYALAHEEVRALHALPVCQRCGGARWIEEDLSHEQQPEYLSMSGDTGDMLKHPRPAQPNSLLNWWKASA